MAQIVNLPTLGGTFGTSLGQGLQQILAGKLDQLRTNDALGKLGFNPQQAAGISDLPPEIRNVIMKQLMQQQVNMGFAQNLSGLMGEQGVQQQQQPTQQQVSTAQQQAAPSGMEALSSLGQQPTQQQVSPAQQQPQGLLNTLDPRRLAGIAPAQQIQVMNAMQKAQRDLQKMEIEQQKMQQKEKQFERKFTSAKEETAFKTTEPYRNSVYDKALSARTNLMDLKRMEVLEGGLETPAYNEFLKSSGLDIPALRTPDSQEFLKIRQGFLRDAKTYLGARITNFELDQFLKTIPDLSQSPEGRVRVIANLKRINNVNIEYADAMKKAIKANKGIPPRDLRAKTEDIMEKRLDKVAEQFRNDISRPVPKFTAVDKASTALGSVLGGIIGVPGKLFGKRGSIGGGGGAEVAEDLLI